MQYEPLEAKVRRALRRHVEEKGGVVSAPEALLDEVLKAVAEWLRHDERQWAEADEEMTAGAIRDLRQNQLRE